MNAGVNYEEEKEEAAEVIIVRRIEDFLQWTP
jgi:hypothetical protein